jgi:pimeloyl-ACP methyl ester carboxylesterase
MGLKTLSTQVLAGNRVWTIGIGPTLVVVHGGPGFNHTYLTPALRPLASHFRLVFYDQRSSATGGGPVTPTALTEQLRRILAAPAPGGPPVVMGHSWGTYLAFACLALPNAPVVRGAVLSSPVPLTRKGYDAGGARWSAQLPERVRPLLQNLNLAGVKKLLPYYLARRNRGKVFIPLTHYDAAAARVIMKALPKDYDFRKVCTSLPKNTHLVIGREDVLSRASDFAAIRRCVAITELSGAAHFAFAERAEAFRSLLIDSFA